MKKIFSLLLIGSLASSLTAATLTVQNSSEDTVRVWLYDSNNALIESWLVATDGPRTLNARLSEISVLLGLQKNTYQKMR